MRNDLSVIWLATKLHFKQTFLEGWVWVHMMLQPFFVILLFLYLVSSRESIAVDVLIGGGMAGMWNSVLANSVWNLEGEKWLGTIELIVASPTHVGNIIIGKNLANMIISLFSFGLSFVFSALVVGTWTPIADQVGFTISLLFTLLSFLSISVLAASLFSVSEFVRSIFNAFTYPVYILCGFFFGISVLPYWTTYISYFLPPFWSAEALRLSSAGNYALSSLGFCWLMSVLLSSVAFVCAAYCFRIYMRRVRVTATYEMI